MRMMGALGVLVTLAVGLLPTRASAHEVGLSRGEYELKGATFQAKIHFARKDLLGLVPAVDEDKDSTLSVADLMAGREALQAMARSGVQVRADGRLCPVESQDARLIEEDGVAVEVRFTCGNEPARVSLELTMLQQLPYGHRHLARAVAGASVVDAVLLQSARTLEVDASAPAKNTTVGGMLWLGIIHILGGLDHLVFLFGLILVGGQLRGLIATITAFTVAHSITIAVAVLGWWTPSSSFVEPAIALSVAYVGVENFFVKSADRRWLITFPFGLIHGFGFAGALGELAVPRDQLVPALLAFNLGVELGQLAVLAVVLPLLFWARRRDWFLTYGVRGLSAVVVVMGLGWFTMRVLGDG
jgi:hydrogenase/urease accessory protein HupE